MLGPTNARAAVLERDHIASNLFFRERRPPASQSVLVRNRPIQTQGQTTERAGTR